jgi:hypothetical protein
MAPRSHDFLKQLVFFLYPPWSVLLHRQTVGARMTDLAIAPTDRRCSNDGAGYCPTDCGSTERCMVTIARGAAVVLAVH